MKPKILIKVIGDAGGDFILEYPDQETLQRSLEKALPALIVGGIFMANKLEFPLRIGGVEHQFNAPTVIDRLHFPGKYTVQECLVKCKEQNVEVVSYTLSKKTTHEFVVRRTHSLKGVTPPMVAVEGADDAPMALSTQKTDDDIFPETPIPPPDKGDEIPPCEEKTTDCYGRPIHVGCGGRVVSLDSSTQKCGKCDYVWNKQETEVDE